jgi:pimeloyl-ACP methyl ester carboxylesterase
MKLSNLSVIFPILGILAFNGPCIQASPLVSDSVSTITMANLRLSDNSTRATLDVEPATQLRDHALHVFKIKHLSPGQRVTVRAQSATLPGGTWTSQADFIADEKGVVDLKQQTPISGSYHSVDAMGLFWSLSTSDPIIMDQMTFGGLPLGTFVVTLTVLDGSNNIVAQQDVTRTSATADQPVTREVWSPLGYQIDLYYPTNGPAKATIVHITGSNGGRVQGYCEMLAAYGYFTACVPYFGEADTPPVLTQIPLEFFRTAIQTVLSHPRAVGNRVIFGGVSYGSNATMLVAELFPDLIKGVVALVTGDYAVVGLEHIVNPTAPPDPAWTLNGQGVPFVSWAWDVVDAQVASQPPPWTLLPAWEVGLKRATTDQLVAARFKVGAIHVPVFLTGGDQDAIWTSGSLARQLASDLRAAGNHDVTTFVGSGAGHYLSVPAYTPAVRTYAGVLVLGGTPDINAIENAAAWRKLLHFLDVHFAN